MVISDRAGELGLRTCSMLSKNYSQWSIVDEPALEPPVDFTSENTWQGIELISPVFDTEQSDWRQECDNTVFLSPRIGVGPGPSDTRSSLAL